MKRLLLVLLLSLGIGNLPAQDSDSDKAAGTAGALLFGTCGCIFCSLVVFAVFIALAVWVYKDAKSRGMDNAMLLTVVTIITGPLGLLIYILMRPKGNLVNCPHCQKKRLEGSAKCPHCGQP